MARGNYRSAVRAPASRARDGRAESTPPIRPERLARHPPGQAARDRQPGPAWFAALAISVVAVTTAAGWRGVPRPGGAAPLTAPVPAAGQEAADRSPPGPPAASRRAAAAGNSAVLSPGARRSCPPAASACADLSTDLTWLQSGGAITYGPVRMEPGPPGTPNATPRGTFHVQWKAGPHYLSTEYHEPMPYAVFFAAGGIAFHGGSLAVASHGCIHLDIGSARYYHDHLPAGAEVVVF